MRAISRPRSSSTPRRRALELAVVAGLLLLSLGLGRLLGGDLGVAVAAGVGVAVSLSAFRSLQIREARLVLLDDIAATLGQAVRAGEAFPAVLRQAYDLLEADRTWLVICRGVRVSAVEYDGAGVIQGLVDAIDVRLMETCAETPSEPVMLDLGHQERGHRRVRHVVAVLLRIGDEDTAILAVGRGPRRWAFRRSDLELLERVALHGEVAIQNVRLVERLRTESEANRYQADHDPLTDLPNRIRFRAEVQAAIDAGECSAVMILDLDRFKDVNDTLGHHNGDLLLREAASRMSLALPPNCLLSRLGGDEFAVLVRSESAESALIEIASILREAMHQPFELAQVQVDVGTSIGIALARVRDEEVPDLLRRADVAMYAAKAEGTGVEVYQFGLDHHSAGRLELVPRFRAAIDHKDLVLYFQPQIDLKTGRVVGSETLIRWPQPGIGFVSPGEFIPIIEQTDLIRPLTRFVISAAAEQCARWLDAGHDLRVSVNLSARNLLEPDLVEHILTVVDREGLRPGSLRVELTETAVMTRPTEALRALKRLRSAGIGVAIDDFGTGQSSLAYLTSLPADELKIDQSFVANLGIDSSAERVIGTIVELGVHLGLDIVAEGVETSQQADLLLAAGCAIGQGYFFGRPVSAADFDRWLADRSRWWRSTSSSAA